MAKSKQKSKKKKNNKNISPKKDRSTDSRMTSPQKKPVKQKPVQSVRKKVLEKKKVGDRGVLVYIDKARQFLRESKMELKKVKWPTKKELLASTAVVIFLTLVMAFYFWLVDWGLMAVIKNILA